MPCATVHLLVARDALSLWENSSQRPFRLHDQTRAAFLHGSLAPDVGFIPGVDRFVSELAHYHRPADLCRALLDHAQSEEDRAFVWGWLAHVLADVALHPMIGRAVGEQIHGDRSRRMDAAEDLPAHVALEVGLDIVLSRKHDNIPPPPSSAYFDDKSIGLLTRTLEQVYECEWNPKQLLRDHGIAVARTRWWPLALRTLRSLAPGWRAAAVAPVGGFALGPARWMSPPTSALRGFFTPQQPRQWLVDCVERGATSVARAVDAYSRDGLDRMENRNLETGQVEHVDETHGGAVLVRARLAALRGGERVSLPPGARVYDDRTTVMAGAEASRRIVGIHELDPVDIGDADGPQ